MAKGKKKKLTKSKPKKTQKNYTTYERDGFVFRFDDEDLQKLYIARFNDFNKILKYMPVPNPISYAHAVGLTRGKTYDRLNKAVILYKNQKDIQYAKGGKHKYDLIDETLTETKGSKTVEQMLEKLDKLMDKVYEATKKVPPKKDHILRYNIVWYQRHPQA